MATIEKPKTKVIQNQFFVSKSANIISVEVEKLFAIFHLIYLFCK